MRQNRWIPQSCAVLCLACLSPGALLAADSAPDGWVIAVDNWTRRNTALKLYQEVFVNDKLQGIAGTIEVALKDGQSPHVYRCDKYPCTIAIPEFRPADDSLISRLGRAFRELYSHRDTMPVSAISRGSQYLHQAVLALNSGQLDLKDAIGTIDMGTYTVSLRPIETAGSTALGRLSGSVNWDPPGGTSASFPALAPGIYELSMASSEGDSLGSVAVLLAAPADYPAKRKSFGAGAQALPRDLDRAALDALLNALLFDIGSSAK